MTRPAKNEIDECARLLGPLARRDEPLGPRTTYRVGGPAAVYVEVPDVAALRTCAAAVAATGVPVLVVGNGSNLLVADEGFPGLAVRLGAAFAEVTIDATTVVAGGAALLPVVARQTVAAGLTGFEWAVGVPGSVGGAVRMNAGGHGSDMAATLRTIRVLDLRTGEDEVVPLARLDLAYRRSRLADSEVVVDATLDLRPGDLARGQALLADIVRWRRDNQPGGPNAGSVFTNPPGDSAGRLIDVVGGRGHRIGSAEISPKHANFIQADAGGSAADVIALMRWAQRRVEEGTGVRLVPETRLVGFAPAVIDELAGRAGGPEPP